MNLIVAVDNNFGIGKSGVMPWHISEDLKYFKAMTLGKTVIMGRKTLESFPGGKPLKNRTNIVLTANRDFECDGVVVCNTVDEVIRKVKKLPPRDVFVIGGASIYSQFLPYCCRAYVTRILADYEVDTYMVDIEDLPDWTFETMGEELESSGVRFRFDVYVNRGTA